MAWGRETGVGRLIGSWLAVKQPPPAAKHRPKKMVKYRINLVKRWSKDGQKGARRGAGDLHAVEALGEVERTVAQRERRQARERVHLPKQRSNNWSKFWSIYWSKMVKKLVGVK